MKAQIRIQYGGLLNITPYWDGATIHGTCWRLYYNLAPGGRVVTRDGEFELGPERIYLMPPGLAFVGSEQGNPKQMFLHFDATAPFDKVREKVYCIEIDQLVRLLLDRLLACIQAPPFYLSESGMMHAIALVGVCLEKLNPDDYGGNKLDPRVDEGIAYLRFHVGQSVQLDDIAQKCGMSKSAFIRLFKRETGTTPYSYLLQMRIDWACELLVGDNISIEVISESTGFNDRFHFSKTFKERMGTSPAAYRETALRERGLVFEGK